MKPRGRGFRLPLSVDRVARDIDDERQAEAAAAVFKILEAA